MWKRFLKFLRCPICKGPFELSAFRQISVAVSDEDAALSHRHGIFDRDFDQFVDSGLLLCDGCKQWFPIRQGLPILVTYTTPFHEQFALDFRQQITQLKLNYEFPCREPVSGERSVMDSFSQEWLDYHYDGVLWDTSYEDHEETFLREVDFNSAQEGNLTYLEIGCGLGITTYLAHKNYKCDAVGVDLSLASLRASQHYKRNPFVHFVQASAFHLPFERESFDIVYSRGVLHHTYSTYEAFKAIAPYSRPGGRLYIWVYGTGSIKESWLRRVAYLAEAMARPILSRRPSSPLTTMFLAVVALAYMAFNAVHRLRNPKIQRYNFKRALHAARDRFTPRYAHRQPCEEVLGWFQEAGFEEIQVVNWQIMPAAQQENYKRNMGIRGKRKLGSRPAVRNLEGAPF